MKLSGKTLFEDETNFPFTLNCPKCHEKQTRTLGELRANPDFTCISCGKVIALDLDELNFGLEAFKDL